MQKELDALVRAVAPLDRGTMTAAEEYQARLAKPPGSLGRLEEISIQLAGITGRVHNALNKKQLLVFAADNGVVAEGVSSAPQSVTKQQSINLMRGKTGAAVLAKHFGCGLTVCDVGVNADIYESTVLNRKIAYGTQNICTGPAMTREQTLQAILTGAEIARTVDADVIGVGEMGIGNTTTSSAVLAVLPYMTRCTFLDMDSCGVSNTAMAAIRDAYPDIKVVWRVWFGDVYTCRTDVKRLLASSESHYINDATSDGLYYCTDVVWLDIGHSSLYDLSFLYNMPDLEVCIVACAPWSDATPIGSLEKLEYLEILSTNCNDISSFANLKNLKHLNIGNCWQIRDITPLYGLTQLERLWIGCVTPVPAEQKEEIREKLPDTLINTQVANHKEGGWCKDENGYNVPRYALLREQFGDYKSWAYAYPWSDILYTKSIDELTPEETQQIKP